MVIWTNKKSYKNYKTVVNHIILIATLAKGYVESTELHWNTNSCWTCHELGIWFFFAWVRGAQEHMEGNDKMLELLLAQLVPHS